MSIGRFFLRVFIPWSITILALWWAFNGIDWGELVSHLRAAKLGWIALAISLTSLSYFLRARRWQLLFPEAQRSNVGVGSSAESEGLSLHYRDSLRVIFLGFMLNNILPARAGELVRAHVGAKVTGASRALVLGTVASERLVDGLTISLMFVAFSFQLGDQEYSRQLSYVAFGFAAISIGVLFVLAARPLILKILRERQGSSLERGDGVESYINGAASADGAGPINGGLNGNRAAKVVNYIGRKAGSFMDGLAPLYSWTTLPALILWSIAIWFLELLVFSFVSNAYGGELTFSEAVLFLVTANFSSLIPAAPGGLGVVEAAVSTVLASIGLGREKALTLALTQHAIQYCVVGIAGAISFFSLKGRIKPADMEAAIGDEEASAVTMVTN